MRVADLVIGETYWARALKPETQDTVFGFMPLAHAVPVLVRNKRVKLSRAQYTPYVYMGAERAHIHSDLRKRTFYLFLKGGMYVYVHSIAISAFIDLSVENMRSRIEQHVGELQISELSVVDSLCDVKKRKRELLFITLHSGVRELHAITRSKHGRSHAVNLLLNRISEIDKYMYFSSMGSRMQLTLKDVQLTAPGPRHG
jgi:hypothetical protein